MPDTNPADTTGYIPSSPPQVVPPLPTSSSRNRWLSGIAITAIGGPFGLLYLMWKRTRWPIPIKAGVSLITTFVMLIGIWGIITPSGRALLFKSSTLIQNRSLPSTSTPQIMNTKQSHPPDWETTDIDIDGIPDQIELLAGLDPTVSADQKCVQESCGEVDTGKTIQKQINTLIILDVSGSMAQTVPGGVKIDVANKVLKEHLSQLPSNSNIGLMIYGHKGSNYEKDKQLSCSSIELVYPLSSPNLTTFSSVIDPLKPTGWTAIGGALEKSKEVFSSHQEEINQVVVITDGIETCDSDPVGKARELKAASITTKIDVIGFGVSSGDASILKHISDAGGGTYYTANNADELRTYTKSTAEELKDLIAIGYCMNSNFRKWQTCAQDQYKKANDYVYAHYKELWQNDSDSVSWDNAIELNKQINDHWLEIYKNRSHSDTDVFQQEFRKVIGSPSTL